jgi:phytoene dehydrogenase-like protein
MKSNFDVVIIGAGISGLMAGALLAKEGKKVLLLEKQPKIGGYLSGFERKGYYFDVGITRSNISYVEPYFREVGILESIHFIKIDADYHVNGRYIPYNNLKEYFAGVADAFPEQKAGTLSFYDKEVARREKNMKTMMYSDFRSMGKFQKYFTILEIFAMMPGMMRDKQNDNSVLKKYIDESSEAFAFLCTRPDQVDYRGHLTMSNYVGKILSQLYNYYPREGYLHLCNLLRKVIIEHGGELMMNSRALKIRIENNVAIGVEYQVKNQQVETVMGENIVSATDLNKTFHDLVGTDFIPPAEMRKLEGSVLGSSVPILFLGVRIPSQRVRQLFNGKEELYYFPTVKKLNADPNDIDFFVNCNMVIHASSLVNPDHAPQGCSNIQIYLSCPPVGWQQNWGLVNGERTEKYGELKKKVIGDVLSSLEGLIPELKDRSIIEVCELGTPHTNERYTGNTHGVALGFNFDGYLLGAPRIRSYYSCLSNVSNLFFIGHQTGYGGGLGTALGSAKRVTNLICQKTH